jgi:hypothetical protein
VALQGTLETFSVPEVLRLLSGTRKTGLLELVGDRGSGGVWLREGRIVAARCDHEQGEAVEAVLFDLLRFETGSFVFEPEAEPDDRLHDADVDDALSAAETLMADWREIESVVPSLDLTVHMVAELDADSVTVTADQWRTLATVGGGATGRRIGDRLGLGEFDASRQLSDLVLAGLVELSDEPDVDLEPTDASASSEWDGVAVDHDTGSAVDHDTGSRFADADAVGPRDDLPAVVDHLLSEDEVASLGHNLAGFVARPADAEDLPDEIAPPAPWEASVDDVAEDGAGDPSAEQEPAGLVERALDASELGEDGEPPACDNFLAQLANLSPRAAAAIEATERGVDPADAVDEALDGDAPGEGDEEIDRNLLLKFLSSAKN